MKAQATARVDVPTARVFPVWTKESNISASFLLRMLGHVLVSQPTVILRRFNVNAWICAPTVTTDDDPALDKNLQCL